MAIYPLIIFLLSARNMSPKIRREGEGGSRRDYACSGTLKRPSESHQKPARFQKVVRAIGHCPWCRLTIARSPWQF